MFANISLFPEQVKIEDIQFLSGTEITMETWNTVFDSFNLALTKYEQQKQTSDNKTRSSKAK